MVKMWEQLEYVVLFDLKPLNEDGNCMAGMYILHEKEPQKLSEHTLEHVKSQNFLRA